MYISRRSKNESIESAIAKQLVNIGINNTSVSISNHQPKTSYLPNFNPETRSARIQSSKPSVSVTGHSSETPKKVTIKNSEFTR